MVKQNYYFSVAVLSQEAKNQYTYSYHLDDYQKRRIGRKHGIYIFVCCSPKETRINHHDTYALRRGFSSTKVPLISLLL